MNVKLMWVTPEADYMVANIARVSNPDNQDSRSIVGLLQYMMREGHVSPFEMAHACLEINTTRDIGRQILRHKSFFFQEFSQRYQSVDKLPVAPLRECRMQDEKNPQSSLETTDTNIIEAWEFAQQEVLYCAEKNYRHMLGMGLAKEQARALLPEGLTASRMYMSGSFRSWIHYLQSRLHPSTQKEHRLIAEEVLDILRGTAPIIMKAFFPTEVVE